MPRRNRNRQNTTAPVVRQIGEWLDISAHEIPPPDPEWDDEPKKYAGAMLRISSIIAVDLSLGDDDEPAECIVTLNGSGVDKEWTFAGSAYDLVRRRVLGANFTEQLDSSAAVTETT